MSHWGNIAVEESYEVVNNGAKLIGEWTRLQHIKNERDGKTTSTCSLECCCLMLGNIPPLDIHDPHCSSLPSFSCTAGTPDSTFTKLHAMLPAGARDIYCRDQIGNVTSTAYWPIKDGISFIVLVFCIE